MAESLICTTETKKPGDGSSSSSLFQRKIVFHPARNPFTGFTNGSSDFKLETLNPSTSSDSSAHKPAYSSAGKKTDAGDLLELGLDPELSFDITFRRIGAGLENLGNTCFLNSVVQCLTYTEPFAAYLQSGKHKSSCRTAGFCALCAIQNHVRRALQSTGRILAPKDLVMNLRCISRSFRNARQEDAHEYMVNLLESMHKCCLPSGVPSESPSAYEKSLVHKIFGGRLRSQVKCMQCSYCSNTFDPFLDLSLEIVKADSLRKALAHFTATEQLDGGQRQYHCERCKQKVKALKQLTVHKAPYVLTIHLKRFGSHIPGQKIDKKVEFGPTLNLKPFVSGSYEGDLKYTLYGVLVHAGWSTHSGHYYCFVRTSSGMWHSLDDNRVVQVSEKTVLQQKAYMLFYVRDRKNLVPKKLNDVISKENVVPSATGNKVQAASAISPNRIVQNALTARRLTDSSSGVIQVDASSGGPLKKPQSKEASVAKTTTGSVISGGSALMKCSQLKSSSKGLANGPSVQQTTNGHFAVGSIPQSAPLSVKGSDSTSHLSDANGVGKILPKIGHQGPREDLSVPVAAPCGLPDCSGSQRSGSEKLVLGKAKHKVGVVNIGNISKVSCEKGNGLKDEKSGSVKPTNHPSTENGQKEGPRVPSEQLNQMAKENVPISKEIVLGESSSQLSMENGIVKKGILDCRHHHKKLLKPKKKLMKYQIASMHLGWKLLFRASLSSCKKKKHKRNKRRILGRKRCDQGNLEDGSGGLEPSTSENTRAIALISTHTKKSGKKKGSDHRATKDVTDSNGESVMNAVVVDQRIDQSIAVLATNEPQQKCSSSALDAKQWDSRELGSSEKKSGVSDNGLTNMLTRVLVETTVPRWDGVVESFPSHNRGLNGERSISIGYVPDEWDEEYDRGKRKKVKNSKNTFDGPNLFQEVATMKARSKKTKTDKTSSGNRPYRI